MARPRADKDEKDNGGERGGEGLAQRVTDIEEALKGALSIDVPGEAAAKREAAEEAEKAAKEAEREAKAEEKEAEKAEETEEGAA